MSSAVPLHILLLGPPDIRWEGKPLKFSRRIQRALLFYLAVEGQVSREALQELFWPSETFHERSNANLRVNLARLRKDLPSDEILRTNKDTLWLNEDQVLIDAVDFLEQVDQPLRFTSQFPSSTLLPEPMVSQLRRAAEMWRSPRFLQGFSISENNPYLERWLENAAWRFNDTYQRVLTSLAGHFAAAGDYSAAIQWADAALDIDPWLENLHIQKIQWLLALNRTNAVLNTIQGLQDQYARENEEIPEELAARFHSIRRQIISYDKNSASEDWPGRLLVQVPLVGRRNELLKLQTAFRRGGIAIIWGETGSGKTRLAYELHRSLQPKPRLLVMNANQGENGLPFHPWIDALRRSISQEEWQNLAPHWRQQIARLLPELALSSDSESTPQNIPPELQPGMLYDALYQTLLMISRHQRVLIVLDSAQWCDSETMLVLAYLVRRRFFTEHGLLVITARHEVQGSPLEAFLDQQSRSAYFNQMDLPALNMAEAEELALQVLDRPAAAGLLERLLADTGGIPLFLLETLYALLEYTPSTMPARITDKIPVGGSIHSFLRGRIENLSLAARQVVEAAAVFESEFDPSLLAALTLANPESIIQGLDELHQAGLIRPVTDGSRPTYIFVYGQMREVIRWGMGPARLRLLHLRAAHVIEEQPDGTVPSLTTLARHYEAAGEWLPAIQSWVKAGLLAHAQFSAEDAVVAFQAADRLVQHDHHNLPENLLDSMYSRWGEIAFNQIDADQMEHIYTRLIQLGEERQSALLLGNGLSGLATLYWLRKDPVRSMEMFQRADYHLQQLNDPAMLVRLYSRQGWYLVGEMRYDEAITLLERARQLVTGEDDPQMIEQRAVIEYRLGMAYNMTGWPLKAQEIALLSLSHDQTPAQMYGHLVMTGAKFYLGEYVAALEHIRLGIKLARSMNSVHLTGYLMNYRLRAELALGQIDTVWSGLPDVFEFALKNHINEIAAYVQMVKGDVYRLLGDFSGAAAFYRAGMEASAGKWDSLMGRLKLGTALALNGEVAEGLRLVDETLAQARQVNMAAVYLPGLSRRAALLMRVGRPDEAIAVLDEYHALFTERHFGLHAYVDGWVRCQVGLQRGDLEEARRQAEVAFQQARRTGNPFWEVEALHLRKLCGAMDAVGTARGRELLALIDRRTRHPDLRRLAEAYLQRARAAQSA